MKTKLSRSVAVCLSVYLKLDHDTREELLGKGMSAYRWESCRRHSRAALSSMVPLGICVPLEKVTEANWAGGEILRNLFMAANVPT